jgi:uncharacterized Zn-finger protein|tara:strand:- start:163 stop:357 length:195 start_codon:yes stop_codon:yes gene_type:complete
MRNQPFPNPEELEEIIIYTTKDSVSCAGEQNDHPRVYLNVPNKVGDEFVQCGYCGIKFARGGSI